MNEYPDNELVNLVCENSEEARDMLYEKYKYIVDIIYNKYKRSAYYLSVDMNELKQEALVGFSDALVCYDQDKDVNLQTFISLCVERRVRNYVRKADTYKNKILRSAYSLDDTYGDLNDIPLIEKIGDNTSDPGITLEEIENIKNLKKEIDELLSLSEKEVYELLINDFSYEDIAKILNKDIKHVYNMVARIRQKIRSILD